MKNLKEIRLEMWPAERTQDFYQNTRPYKRRNTRGSITKNNRREDFTKIHLHIRQEMQLLERTQEYETKYDL